jgi:hypothetical protein
MGCNEERKQIDHGLASDLGEYILLSAIKEQRVKNICE